MRSGRAPASTVQTAQQHADKQRALTRQGLQRLTQIATLILLAAVLAMAAAIGAMIWQRRPRLAKLKLEGFSPAELWATILLESVLLLAVGCASGALFGLLGQQLLDRALAAIINYPVVHSLALLVRARQPRARHRRRRGDPRDPRLLRRARARRARARRLRARPAAAWASARR